jgi:hypothetical protein
MAEAIPGINNVTRQVRPFSLMAWITWKYRKLAGENPPTNHREAFTKFRERAETLFTWSHWIKGRRDLPGMRSFRPPIEDDGKATLNFHSWQRQADSTSYFAAVQYGPASKEKTGLGILKSIGAHLPLEPSSIIGENLAKRLDERLRQCTVYERLFSGLGDVRASESDASDLYSAWSLDKPSDAECSTFRDALFPTGHADPIATRRCEIIDRIRKQVIAHAPLSVHRLRSLLATFPGAPVSDSVEARWLVLQLRQAQRLGFEVLFHHLETLAIKRGAHRAEVTAEILSAITSEPFAPSTKDCINNWHEWCARRWSTPKMLLAGIEGENEGSPIVLSEKAHSLITGKEENDERMATGLAFTLLLIIAYSVFQFCAGSAQTVRSLMIRGNGTGSRDRFSLLYWAEMVERERKTPLREFLDSLLFEELLSRHIFTASRRADGSSNRLRIAYDGDRWTTFVNKPASVAFTPDRLIALVSLMAECGLLSRSEVVIE